MSDPDARHAYMVNVASARNGVGYGRWTHIDGFSEAVFRFMHAHEASAACLTGLDLAAWCRRAAACAKSPCRYDRPTCANLTRDETS